MFNASATEELRLHSNLQTPSSNNKTMTSVSSVEASAAAVFLIFSLESV